jgi:hypothetical protein
MDNVQKHNIYTNYSIVTCASVAAENFLPRRCLVMDVSLAPLFRPSGVISQYYICINPYMRCNCNSCDGAE